jgi:hypothetical protein
MILRQAQDERGNKLKIKDQKSKVQIKSQKLGYVCAIILALGRDKVGNFSGSDTNRGISSTIVNQ